ALATGATLCLKPTGTVFAGQLLLDLLEKLAISVVTLPPSLLASLPSTTLPHLRTLIVAGEACPPELIKIWAGSRNFFNAYGPTESTVCATIAACDATNAQHPPIGKAIARTQAIVLDQQLEVVPPGVVGTLYLSGVRLAQGYI